MVRVQAAPYGLHDIQIYLADLQEDVLRLLTGKGLDARQEAEQQETNLEVESTLAGRAFQNLKALHEAGAGRNRWWEPLLDGFDRIGVMRIDLDDAVEDARPVMRQLASLVTMMIVTKRPYSDSYIQLRRTQPMNVAAEMQWNLMPPRSVANDRVTISAALEPAYAIGGDVFDYSLADDNAHLKIFDAMGHDVAAGLAANLALAACRNSRRQGVGLMDIGPVVEKTLIEWHGDDTRYVTALLLDLDTHTGELTWVSYGHHPPVVLRGGCWAGLLSCPNPGAPLGTGLGLEATLCHDKLNPGDRLILYTDGITEARNRDGEEFGLDRFMNYIIQQNAEGLPVPETLRRLVHAMMAHHEGQLRDDATVVFLEWHGDIQRTSYSSIAA